MRIHIYIDGNNLHKSAKSIGYIIDYKKFRGWLRQKYQPTEVYIFIGLVPNKTKLYEYLEMSGYKVIFKKTLVVKNVIKGNCDAELVLKVVSDFYTKSFDRCYLITGDGDFGCLVDFLNQNNAIIGVIAPSKRGCSFLIREKNIEITFLDSLYPKFSTQYKEKAPDADVSA